MSMIIERKCLDADVSAPLSRLLNVRNLVAAGALISSLVVAVFPGQAQTQKTEIWDMEFTGKGDPRDAGFKGRTVNSATYNPYDKFTGNDVFPGWMTANGNPGGSFYKNSENRNTRADGWTAEWRLSVERNGQGLALNFNDDTSLVKVIYDAPANTVTLEDYLIGLDGNTQSVSVSTTIGERAVHTYRLVRQPASPTVELYIDNDPAAVASITPWPAADHGNEGQLEQVIFAHSPLNAAWDFFRYHSGATIPGAKPAPATSTLRGKAHDGYRTCVITPPINNEAILDGQRLPDVCTDGQVMKILCARGEYEPASFLVLTERPLKNVMVTVDDLTGPAGVLDSDTVDVRIAQKFYRVITWESVTMPWVLVHDPAMYTIIDRPQKWATEITEENWDHSGGHTLEEYQNGYTKTNELNKELIDTNTLQPADITGSRQFWLTLHVPEDAKSGSYRGDVTITAANAESATLTLEVTVPSFDLLPPQFEYSIYYPTQLERPTTTDGQREKYHPVTEQQYLAENRNMAVHGCLNPCLYAGPEQDEAGNIHFTHLSRLLDLREQAGMPKGVMLYLMDGAGMILKTGELTEQETQRNIEVARTTVAWAKARGYKGALFMGADEYAGSRLHAMRESYASVSEGGSGIWVAGGRDLVTDMADVVDVPVFAHPGALAVDQQVQWQVDAIAWLLHPERTPNWDPEIFLSPSYQNLITRTHEKGNKIFTYFDPQGGQPFPEYHRRHRGLGLWKTGIDGTMTWAYIHIWSKTVRTDDPAIKDNGVGHSPNSFVLRGPAGPLDTLSWEGYREGCDDARYLATLQDALKKAKAAGKHTGAVARTERWLEGIKVNDDLDAWRWEMARRTELLLQ
ncbi:MAG: hypothetical protein QF541_12220 [Lentisphaeria bacterium]|jgi:hypothetical protein|nr:hypothetical protein [Lentisphaeria bacterium]